MTSLPTPAALRGEADKLRQQLDRLERLDWPRWLREADEVTRTISELRRRAAELDRPQSRAPAERSPPA